MIPYVKLAEIMEKEGKRTGYTLLDERHGCVNGSRCGVSFYALDEYDYTRMGAHDDQEGFLVLEGYGKAMIGGEELDLEPGMCFMIPAGVPHGMIRAKGSEYCKVFWFHAAI
ncbi:MAG: cupin domain-containing protein [Lachnospiraceae bacterium]|nr:cupin domain-containing protein [Lachnospiraceae bacterium]